MTVKAIIPPKFNNRAFLDKFQDAAREFADLPKEDFEKVVRYWSGDKPTFVKEVRETSKAVMVIIRVTGGKGKDKFNWVDLGTTPHKIRAKNGKTLRFNSGTHIAGSTPGTTAVRKASPAKGVVVYPVEVNHPGSKARNWREVIKNRNMPHFRGLLMRAMRDGAKASGHSSK